MKTESQQAHQWLQKLVGEWTCRRLRSQMLDDDGRWHEIMTTDYGRIK